VGDGVARENDDGDEHYADASSWYNDVKDIHMYFIIVKA